MSRTLALFFLAVAASAYALAADAPVSLRLAGDPAVAPVVQRWIDGYHRLHPDVVISTHLSGTDTGMAALYTGTADITLMGRAPYPIEIQAFEWVFKYKPTQTQVMSGSLSRNGASPALVLLVNRGNPLTSLSLDQLARVFGGDPVETAPKVWGDLGLAGEWKDRPIHLYMPDAMSGSGRFFRHVVLADARMMNWDQITEFAEPNDDSQPSANRQVASAVASDPAGLGVGALEGLPAEAKAVALASTPSGNPELPTAESVIRRTYPFSRAVIACTNRAPGHPLAPALVDFLSFLLSEAGQAEVIGSGDFLPLGKESISGQQSTLR